MDGCSFSKLVDVLHLLAPPELAAEWDNTGLLLEGAHSRIHKLLLTLDLTPAVAEEAVSENVQGIVSYHPPLFGGVDRLTSADPLHHALLRLIRAGIHVHSPHTALDAAPGGVSDWLASCFSAASIESRDGSARELALVPGLKLADLCVQWQSHLGAPYLRVVRPSGRSRKIRTLALCPGAGSSALAGLVVDAVLTGEMKHHDMLAWRRRGVAVVLSEHGHTERPYLAVLRKRLRESLPDVEVRVSRRDREPVEWMNARA